MTNWNETLHPRATAGTFTDKQHSTPELVLEAVNDSVDEPTTSPELEAMLVSADPAWRKNIAENLDTPPALLEALARSTDRDDRMHVAMNGSLSRTTLLRLASDPEEYVRESDAGNDRAPADALDKLTAEDREEGLEYTVCELVARNPNASEEAIRRLATIEEDADYIVAAAAQHPRLPADTHKALVAHPSHIVRRGVALSHSIPFEAKHALITDTSEAVRAEVAGAQSTPADVLHRFADDTSVVVRRRLAARWGLPEEIRQRLLTDPDADVRDLVAARF
jgi:hypothetical protein